VRVRFAWPLLAVVLVAGCASAADDAAPTAPTALGRDVAPGVTGTLTPPPAPGSAPLVVLVPGGRWLSADPTGLMPLAEALADAGAAAATITYRTASDEAYFPQPARDVACGTAWAAARAGEDGYPPTEVVLVGHSAGATLAALAALAPEDLGSHECPYPPVQADRLVGLAGPYDVVQVADVAVDLFGPQRPDPQTWAVGNPVTKGDRRPDVAVLLVHGRDDDMVPLASSGAFADALEAGGHAVTTRWLDGIDHQSVYAADVAGPLIVDWLGLEATGASGRTEAP
jgi:acetyl esterase/lipase